MLSRNKPLDGVKVLDLTQALAGPYATQLLSDLGADVVKVESPRHPDSTRSVPPFMGEFSHYFVSINHDKRSISLNLKDSADRATFMRLSERADVVISNYRAGVMEGLGIGPDVLAARNPRLIQCLLSGFGQTASEYRTKAVYDANIQAMTGFMSLTAEPDGPPFRCGVSIGDLVPGLFATQAITTALYDRERTGKGQVLDVAMFDCLFSFLTYYIPLTQATGRPPVPSGAMHSSVVPMGRFRASDGWLMIAAFTEQFWRKFCVAIQQPELGVDSRFATMSDRLQNRHVLMPILSEIILTKSQSEWVSLLEGHDVPNAPVLDVIEVLEHPIVDARHLLRQQTLPDGTVVNVPRHPVVYGTELEDRGPASAAPRLGEHNESVIAEWLKDDALAPFSQV
jgi:CoA:oxalate CoA-transferase